MKVKEWIEQIIIEVEQEGINHDASIALLMGMICGGLITAGLVKIIEILY